jgi:hypothetical protein
MAQPAEVWSLYRNSIVGIPKIHVATFDTVEGGTYNRENCLLAARLFQEQGAVQTSFWCEPGRSAD